MQKYQNTVQDQYGNAVSGASVSVYAIGTTTPSTIYSDDGITTQANPITTDSLGRFSFYAADGRYDIAISGTRVTSFTLSDILLEDTEDGAFTQSTTISVSSSSAALTVTQTGTGNALVVEDSANPDSTPFVIDATGKVIVGHTAAIGNELVQQIGTTYASSASKNLCFAATNDGPYLIHGKSRGTSVGDYTIVADNDALGNIQFRGADGSALVPAATIRAFADGTPEAGSMPGRITFSTTPSGSSTPAERMRIDSAGQVSVTANNSTNALKITQTGTGNALVVEDSANPDSTPFVIDADGKTILGHTSAVNGYATISPPLQIHGVSGVSTNSLSISSWINNSASATRVILQKSNSGTIGTNGVNSLASGGALGAIDFTGDDGSAFRAAASIESYVDGTPGTNDMPGRLVFSTTADGASIPTERMRIDSSGNVGIGTSSPGVKLDINGGVRSQGWGGSSTAGIYFFGASATPAQIYGDSSLMAIYTNGSERMRINSSGNVLVTNAGGGLGYGTGAGGTVTQATSKSTAVTLNKPTGQITMNNAALAAGAQVNFTLTNSLITVNDLILVNVRTPTAASYSVRAGDIAGGSCLISLINVSGSSLADAVVISFAIIKGATA